MRNAIAACVLGAALAMMPVGASAAGLTGQAKTARTTKAAGKTALGTHSTRGVVKSVDATTLVVTRSGKHGHDMTFKLESDTRKQGTIDVGTPVSVRYREDGTTNIATAVTARRPAKS